MLSHQQSDLQTGQHLQYKNELMALNPLCLVALLAVINAILPALLLSLSQQSLSEALLSGFGQSFIIWFSLYVCFQLYFSAPINEKDCPPIRTWHYLFALMLSIMLIFPFALSSWICAAIASLTWRFCIPKAKRSSKRAYVSLLLFALAIREPSAQFFLQIMAEQVLAIDAQLAFLLLDLFSDQVSLQNNIIVNQEGTNLIILTGCSAFGNLSLALLLYISLAIYWSNKLVIKDIYKMLVLVILVLLCNSSRLALMTLSSESYTFIHDGLGANIFDTLILLLPVIILMLPSTLRSKK